MLAWKSFKTSRFCFALQLAFLLLAVFLFFAPDIALAQGTFGTDPVADNIALASTDIRIIIVRIINVFLGLLGIIAVSIIVYGGFTYMTSGGAEDKIANAKKIMINGVVGLTVILSAFAIVQFVFRSLSDATGIGGGRNAGAGRGFGFQNFAGSGALGDIVDDHFPFRGAVDVPRNTRIAVTFSEPINPASLMENTNGSCWGDNGQPTLNCPAGAVPYFGDCQVPAGEALNPAIHCDQILADSVKVFKVPEDNADPVMELASAAAVYDAQGQVNTFVFLPNEPLGSNEEPKRYQVELTSDILKAEGGDVSAFANDRDGRYYWNFTVGTEFDFDPPHVSRVYPREGQTIARNSILQVTFNEAMNPIAVAGILRANGAFSNVIFGDIQVEGQWKITNGYKTIEFVPSEACGQNSCGEIMYCLPHICGGDETCGHEVLVRTAELLDDGVFTATPEITGSIDMAGNALDGRSDAEVLISHDNVPQNKPAVVAERQINAAEKVADNFWWSFNVDNTIDRSVPNITRVLPVLDQGNVESDAPLQVFFSKPMWLSTFTGIAVEEYPGEARPGNPIPDGFEDIRNMWIRAVSDADADGNTITNIEHREFGPNNFDLYYFPNLPSTIKSVNQNCIYPGRGPAYDQAASRAAAAGAAEPPDCEVVADINGAVNPGPNCAPVNGEAETDTGCVTTQGNNLVTSNIDACLLQMRQNSPRFAPGQ